MHIELIRALLLQLSNFSMLKVLIFIRWLKIEKVSLCYFSYASIENSKILGLYVTHGALSADKRYGCSQVEKNSMHWIMDLIFEYFGCS